VAGALDAVIAPDVLPSVQRGDPAVGRLFADYRAEEQAFYRRTRLFPISHLVILKDAVVRADPTTPLRLLDLFRRARDACFRRIEEQQILALSWAGALLAEQRALMGPRYWPYNVADNRLALDTLLGFAHEQGVIPRPLTIEELFLPDTLTAPGA
jgi:4,5-dihydroxyphthalate decarboxylase